jgi:hypothetical protein
VDNPIMKCGHAANSLGKPAHYTGEPIPACAICSCFEVAEVQPDMKNRIARCCYYGQTIGRRGSCDYPEDVHPKDNICRCEAKSDNLSLPFFKHTPEKEFDEFYCGCACGWD